MMTPRLPRAAAPFRAAALLPAAALLLGACATSTTGVANRYPGRNADLPPPLPAPAAAPAPVPPLARLADAEAQATRGELAAAIASYQRALPAAPSGTAADYRLRMAELSNRAGQPAQADNLLDQIPASALASRRQSAAYRLVRAETALLRNDPRRALTLLPSSDATLEPEFAARQLDARATALARTGDALGALQARINRERYLSGAAVAANRNTLWSELAAHAPDATLPARAASANPVARGWIDLAVLAHKPGATEADYLAWRSHYPAHPADERAGLLARSALPAPIVAPIAAPAPAAVAAAGIAAKPAATASASGDASETAPTAAPATPTPGATTPAATTPDPAGDSGGIAAPGLPVAPAVPVATAPLPPTGSGQSGSIALLLPSSGPLAPYGEALTAGFAARAGGTPRRYDTIGQDIVALYRTAVADGATLVVGPLLKDAAATLAASGAITTPVLALNYLDAGKPGAATLWQLGLAPEDEARAAADDAAARGLKRALVLVPDSEAGSRVLAAFRARLGELGGHVVDSARYGGDPSSWSDPIRKLLRYVAINDKKKAAEARAKVEPGIDPQRRNDFDYVFVFGRAAQTRVLYPLLRYYHADRVPAYTTAASYEADGDSDLAGLRFCDAPWLLDASGSWTALRTAAMQGRSLDLARFYALGNDAEALAERLRRGALNAGENAPGAIGTLHADAGGAVHRGLSCARLGAGAPQLLPAPDSGAPAP